MTNGGVIFPLRGTSRGIISGGAYRAKAKIESRIINIIYVHTCIRKSWYVMQTIIHVIPTESLEKSLISVHVLMIRSHQPPTKTGSVVGMRLARCRAHVLAHQ